MKKVLVTGADGFIGSNLCKHLSNLGHSVTALSRKNTGVDILDLDALSKIASGHDTVFHTAAFISFNPSEYQQAYDVNVVGSRNVLQAALDNKVKKVIHLSACAVLGLSDNASKILDENSRPEISKTNVYAYTKNLAEEEVGKFVQQGLDVSIANISTVYGSGDHKLNSGSIIKNINAGGMNFVPPGGTSYVAMNDLLDGLVLLEQGRPGESYIISNENLSYVELVNRIASVLNKPKTPRTIPGVFYLPMFLAVSLLERFNKGSDQVNLMTSQIVKEVFNYKYFSSEKIRKELNWSPKHSLEDAVQDALAYYQEHKLL